MSLKLFKQETDYSCGAASFRIVLHSLGIEKTEEELVKLLNTSPGHGTWFKDLIEALKLYNLEHVVKSDSSIPELRKFLQQGYRIIVCYAILRQNSDHFSVVKKIDKENIYFLDPWLGGNHKFSLRHFRRIWKSRRRQDQAAKWFIAIKKGDSDYEKPDTQRL